MARLDVVAGEGKTGGGWGLRIGAKPFAPGAVLLQAGRDRVGGGLVRRTGRAGSHRGGAATGGAAGAGWWGECGVAAGAGWGGRFRAGGALRGGGVVCGGGGRGGGGGERRAGARGGVGGACWRGGWCCYRNVVSL